MQNTHDNVAIFIPSREGSQRLPQKPLKQIGNATMIERVLSRVKETGLKHIYVATDSEKIAEVVRACGGKYIMTNPALNSGTERVMAAFELMPEGESIDYVINVQGDMPFVDPATILNVIDSLKNSKYQIMTPVTKVTQEIADGASNVKVVVDKNDRALYFSRSMIPHYASEFLYHVGIYGFTKESLQRFVNLPISYLEESEKLEQLRALENGIEIGVCYSDNVPISVDTEEDLAKAIAFYNSNIKN